MSDLPNPTSLAPVTLCQARPRILERRFHIDMWDALSESDRHRLLYEIALFAERQDYLFYSRHTQYETNEVVYRFYPRGIDVAGASLALDGSRQALLARRYQHPGSEAALYYTGV